MKQSIVTLTVVVDHSEGEDPIEIIEGLLLREEAGRVNAVVEPHVDSTEDVGD